MCVLCLYMVSSSTMWSKTEPPEKVLKVLIVTALMINNRSGDSCSLLDDVVEDRAAREMLHEQADVVRGLVDGLISMSVV